MGKNNPDNASRKTERGVLTLRITRSMRAAGRDQIASNSALEASVEPVKLTEKKTRGKKRKAVEEQMNPGGTTSNDATEPENLPKRSKMKAGDAYIDPFANSQTIPEPSLSVAEHEEHSRHMVHAKTSHSPGDTDSPFTQSLPAVARDSASSDVGVTSQSIYIPENPLLQPNSLVSVNTPSASVSTVTKPKSTARNQLTLAPLSSKPRIPNTRTVRETSTMPSATRPFLAPPSTRFAAPSSALSTNNRMQTPAQSSDFPLSSIPVAKTSKHVTDKLSNIEARLCRLEEELRVVTLSEKDAQRRQQKILDENKELLKQNERLDCEVGELREEVDTQKKTLASIHAMLANLKTNGGDAAKAVVKVEKAVRDNAWNVSRHGSVKVSADEPVSRVVLVKPSSGLWVYLM
jgi:hypothetical protein